jgi:hypothetical protein
MAILGILQIVSFFAILIAIITHLGIHDPGLSG